MTPDDLKAIRRALGLTAQGFANAVGVASGRTVRKWEHGDRDVPGPVVKLLEIWSDPRLPKDLRPQTTCWKPAQPKQRQPESEHQTKT